MIFLVLIPIVALAVIAAGLVVFSPTSSKAMESDPCNALCTLYDNADCTSSYCKDTSSWFSKGTLMCVNLDITCDEAKLRLASELAIRNEPTTTTSTTTSTTTIHPYVIGWGQLADRLRSSAATTDSPSHPISQTRQLKRNEGKMVDPKSRALEEETTDMEDRAVVSEWSVVEGKRIRPVLESEKRHMELDNIDSKSARAGHVFVESSNFKYVKVTKAPRTTRSPTTTSTAEEVQEDEEEEVVVEDAADDTTTTTVTEEAASMTSTEEITSTSPNLIPDVVAAKPKRITGGRRMRRGLQDLDDPCFDEVSSICISS